MKRLYSLLIISFSLYATCYAQADANALDIYKEAETATTKEEKQKLFNQALSSYLHIEIPSYELYYNIGNCYYQLGQYGYAILYYYRSLLINPRFDKAYENLQTTAAKIGLELTREPSTYTLKPQEKQYIFLIFLLMTFIFSSLYFLLSQKFFLHTGIFFSLFVLFFLCNMTWNTYMQPVEAVIIQSSALYKEASTQYETIATKFPLYGEKVSVLEYTQDAHWVHIRTEHDETGFIPSNCLATIAAQPS